MYVRKIVHAYQTYCFIGIIVLEASQLWVVPCFMVDCLKVA